jgi:hypothetical protein
MTDTHPSPAPSVDSCRPPESRMNFAFLCNPNKEDSRLRGHHTSEFFSNELDDTEKRTLAEGCNCE